MTDRTHAAARPARPTARNVPALLLTLRQEEFTGSVTVSSAPGGTIHLEQGLVTAIETPGAPTVETLLLKSRRVGEADWAAAATTAAAAPGPRAGDLGAALVAQGSIGAAELETVCAAAVFDGAFALVLSPPGSWEVAEAAAPAGLALRPGVEPQRLFEETGQRVALLTRLWGPPGELARSRIRPAAQTESKALRIPARHREILVAATGRRTARDIGFALGRGLFAVLLDVVRMDARQLLHREPIRPATGVPSVAPRTPHTGPPPASAGPLPRRIPGRRGPEGQGGTGGTAVLTTATDPAGPATRPGAPAAASDRPPNDHRAERTEKTEETEKSAP
ncbi:hypothetical protein ACWDRR_31185 [Kitasatospora sp. NPDC003701]